MRARSIILATLILVSTLALSSAVRATDATTDHLVQASSASLAPYGLDVIDDYGAFVTARLTPDEATRLAANGIAIAPLDHTLGRGDVRLSALGPDMRAPADSPLQIVQFRGPVKAEWAAALGAHALAVYDYLPDQSYLARVTPAAADALRAMPEVRALEPYHPAWKLAPELHSAGVARVTALAFLDAPLADVLAQIAATGALPADATTAQLEHVIDLMATPEQVRAIARLDTIAWIEPAYDEASTDNEQSSAITQGATTSAWPLHAKGVDGSSQVTSVCDTGVNTDPVVPLAAGQNVPLNLIRMHHEMHDDAAQPYLVYNQHTAPVQFPLPHRKMDLYYSPTENNVTRGDADDGDGHGTHTGGTLAGDAPPYGERNNHDGVAFAAKLLVCDIVIGTSFQILNNYANYWDPALDRGALVNSNSWGSSHTSSYTEKARQHDAYVWSNRDFVILRSMGNIPSTIRPEAVAKSALGIGATQNGAGMENVASFSGVGLTQDGRMKPNVIAPGDCLFSSYGSAVNGYGCLAGTSMSTPTVAGAATLLHDYFEKGFYPSGSANAGDAMTPSSAMTRALLQISGREVAGDRSTAGFPNRVQGWGRVTLDDALYFAGDAKRLRILDDESTSATTGSAHAYTLTVAAGQPLRVMLAWSDYPAAAGANPAIVNNLDLRVTDPNGNVLGVADAKNVEEAVYVASPVAGTYTVTVTGVNVPMGGGQPFALVATGGVS